MPSIENKGFISHIRFFLSLTLLYKIKFNQILTQTLIKKVSESSKYQNIHHRQLLKHQ